MKKKEDFYDTLLRYTEFLGVKKINELPGLWVHKIDEHWAIKCNAHKQEIEGIAPYSWYVEFNGWPFASFDMLGTGVFGNGEIANVKTLQEVLSSRQ